LSKIILLFRFPVHIFRLLDNDEGDGVQVFIMNKTVYGSKIGRIMTTCKWSKTMKTGNCIMFLAGLFFLCTPTITFAMEQNFSDEDKEFLIRLARNTLTQYLKDGSILKIEDKQVSKSLREKGACFVTLTKKGTGLRGCIGIFERNLPLYRNVIDRAISAAVHDSRFPKVGYEELKDIKIEISVLTAPEKIGFHSPEDLLAKLRPGIDGVILKTRYGSSTFLPQVWEQIPDKEQFMSYLSRKHGAPGMIWKSNYQDIEVQTYQAIVFGEETYGGSAKNGR